MTTSQKRNDTVAKRVSVIFGALCFIVLLVLVSLFGFNVNSPIIFGLGILFFSIGFIIDRGYSITGRILLCAVPPVVTLIGALLAKMFAHKFTDILYYDARLILIMVSVLPCLVFDLEERVALVATTLVPMACIIVFDPIHNALGIGYFQKGFLSRSYYYINYITVISAVGIVAGSLALKRIVHFSEQKYVLTIKRLGIAFRNQRLQNEQIRDQQAQLQAANALIEKQKQALEMKVLETNANLQGANDELIRHNNELRQFSYTISHNLRGPIARLLGLANLLNLPSNQESDIKTIIDHIQRSAKDLDETIKDLNEIVDIRNNVLQTKEVIEWKNEFERLQSLLQLSDEFVKRHFTIDFACATIVSNRSMVASILYNLVSNAIKYKSPTRSLSVSVRTYTRENMQVLEVHDNGLGIDLGLFRNDLFKMYKRFHTHRDGKGIGLYLVKSQVEALNGWIDVQSSTDNGAKFTVGFFSQPVADVRITSAASV